MGMIPAQAVEKGMHSVNEALDLLLAGRITAAQYLEVVDASYVPPGDAK